MRTSPSDWLEKKGDKIIWEPPPVGVEPSLELLLETNI